MEPPVSVSLKKNIIYSSLDPRTLLCQQKSMNTPFFLPIAVPSWMIPGTCAENARFLASQAPPTARVRITEMGLCCFEAAASLTCPLTDYPTASPLLSLHVHLPVDLAWTSGQPPQQVMPLMARLASQGVTRAVLHPPAGGTDSALLAALIEAWSASGRSPADLLLENHRDINATDFLSLLDRHPVSVCLDVAHMWTYNQNALLSRLDPHRVKLVHWSAPGAVRGKDAHLPLSRLSAAEIVSAHEVAARFPTALPLVEVFSWEGILASLPLLTDMYGFSDLTA